MQSKKILRCLSIIFIFAFLFSGCVTGRHEMYHDPATDRTSISISRIAIAPNRLPINLTNPENWRKHNWRIASGFLKRKGYDVVDYNTTVEAFDRSGLRIEDTQLSRDKYADLSEELSVDVIVIPYYGTFASSKPFLFANYLSWNSVATFQFYFADANEFVTRIDMSGSSSYLQGILTIVAFGVTFIEPTAGLITMGVGTIADLSQTVFRSNNSHWGAAFNSAITRGLRGFAATFPPGRAYSVKKPDRIKQGKPAPDSGDSIRVKIRQTEESENQSHAYKEGDIFNFQSFDKKANILRIKPSEVLLNIGAQKGVMNGYTCFILKKLNNTDTYKILHKGRIVRVRGDASVAFFRDTSALHPGMTVIIRAL